MEVGRCRLLLWQQICQKINSSKKKKGKKKEERGSLVIAKSLLCLLKTAFWFGRACKLKVKRCCKLCTFLQKHFVQLQLSNCGNSTPPPPFPRAAQACWLGLRAQGSIRWPAPLFCANLFWSPFTRSAAVQGLC